MTHERMTELLDSIAEAVRVLRGCDPERVGTHMRLTQIDAEIWQGVDAVEEEAE